MSGPVIEVADWVILLAPLSFGARLPAAKKATPAMIKIFFIALFCFIWEVCVAKDEKVTGGGEYFFMKA